MQGAEWAHGDLGSVRGGDVLVGFSHSGGTVEMVGAAHWFKDRGAHVVAVTGRAAGESALGRAAGAHLLAAAPQELLGEGDTMQKGGCSTFGGRVKAADGGVPV